MKKCGKLLIISSKYFAVRLDSLHYPSKCQKGLPFSGASSQWPICQLCLAKQLLQFEHLKHVSDVLKTLRDRKLREVFCLKNTHTVCNGSTSGSNGRCPINTAHIFQELVLIRVAPAWPKQSLHPSAQPPLSIRKCAASSSLTGLHRSVRDGQSVLWRRCSCNSCASAKEDPLFREQHIHHAMQCDLVSPWFTIPSGRLKASHTCNSRNSRSPWDHSNSLSKHPLLSEKCQPLLDVGAIWAAQKFQSFTNTGAWLMRNKLHHCHMLLLLSIYFRLGHWYKCPLYMILRLISNNSPQPLNQLPSMPSILRQVAWSAQARSKWSKSWRSTEPCSNEK